MYLVNHFMTVTSVSVGASYAVNRGRSRAREISLDTTFHLHQATPPYNQPLLSVGSLPNPYLSTRRVARKMADNTGKIRISEPSQTFKPPCYSRSGPSQGVYVRAGCNDVLGSERMRSRQLAEISNNPSPEQNENAWNLSSGLFSNHISQSIVGPHLDSAQPV